MDSEILFGWLFSAVSGRSVSCLYVDEDPDQVEQDEILQRVRSQRISDEDRWHLRMDGSRFWGNSLTLAWTVNDESGFVLVVRDRSQEVANESISRQNIADFQLLTETIPQLVWRSFDDGDWSWSGPQWVAYTGQSAADSLCQGWLDRVHPEDRLATRRAWHNALFRGGLEIEHRIRRADGVYRWFQTRALAADDGSGPQMVRHWFGTTTDVDDLSRAEERVRFLAYHDVLTGCGNRALLQQVLRKATEAGSLSRTVCNVLYVDLDRFKAVNDRLGHRGGDALLQQVAKRLQICVNERDLVARSGGDEFVLVQLESEPEAAVQLADDVTHALFESFVIDIQELHVSACIGSASFPRDGDNADDLLRRADLALYRAKARGGGHACVFEPALEADLRYRQTLERDLVGAIERHDLAVHYQGIFEVSTHRLCGFEGLARWTHPQHADVPPATFISIAEECGLIAPLGALILDLVCATAAHWRGVELVSVNISPAQFQHGDLTRTIAEALARNGLAPDRLELEVTESLLMEESDQVLGTLRAIKALGVRIALDDFGTGFSSLGYLCRFPFDKVKIDQSFIRRMETDAGSRTIINAVIALGHSLGLLVTAEGVENESQLSMLGNMGCDQAQGFLLSRPAPGHDVERTYPLIRRQAGSILH